MSDAGFRLYGHQMLETCVNFWPEGTIVVFYETEPFQIHHERIHQVSMRSIAGYDLFQTAVEHFPSMRGWFGDRYDYRYDICKFSKKVFAQCEAARHCHGHLCWLDADVISVGRIDRDFLSSLIDGYFVAFMGRQCWHACTSFVIWDCAHKCSNQWWHIYRNTFINGHVFRLQQWNDAFALEYLVKATEVSANNISADIHEAGPFNVLNRVFHGKAYHYKGNAKYAFGEMSRYACLIRLIESLEPKPRRILEVGTWNGYRGLEMCRAAGGAEYFGFDLFELATAESDLKERNVKPHIALAGVYQYLTSHGIVCKLYRGISTETLPAYLKEYGSRSADFVLIDGGHSIETIRSDLAFAKVLVKPGGAVVVDDYYVGVPERELDNWGANNVVKGENYQLLDGADPIAGGGMARMAMLRF
ncbi:MAG: class I SAM-dependent methyltransferase [Nitrososphaera sp.]|nr:class I SAM-dependent methyltransferase [Nitrososphaera sp.]